MHPKTTTRNSNSLTPTVKFVRNDLVEADVHYSGPLEPNQHHTLLASRQHHGGASIFDHNAAKQWLDCSLSRVLGTPHFSFMQIGDGHFPGAL